MFHIIFSLRFEKYIASCGTNLIVVFLSETSKKIKKRKCKPPIETFFEDLPRKRLSKEEKKYIEESLVCSDLEELPPARRRGLGPLNVIDVRI